MSDEGSYEKVSQRWELIEHFYKPETEKLPEHDKNYFESAISLITGKEIKTSNLKEKWMDYFMFKADYILNLKWFPMLVPREYINKEIAEYLNKLGLPMSVEALGTLYGPMSFSHQTVKQEIVGGTPTIERE
jgi:hypothetical protein